MLTNDPGARGGGDIGLLLSGKLGVQSRAQAIARARELRSLLLTRVIPQESPHSYNFGV